MTGERLVWSPVFAGFSDSLVEGESLNLVISPFTKTSALKRLLELPCAPELAVISRWRPEELLAGVSDLEIYPYLRQRNTKLYLHNDIHLKLFTLTTDRALCSSANVTAKGLGLRERANIEAGVIVSLSFEDAVQIKRIRDESRLVTDEVYEAYRECVSQGTFKRAEVPEIDLPEEPDTRYLISALPATESPRKLFAVYSDPASASQDERRRCIHDLCNFKVPSKLQEEEFLRTVGRSFRNSAFVQDIVSRIEEEGAMRFGAVNDFIHKNCRDVPLPYKWEIKETTNFLYNWLVYYYDELSWSRPGSRSQVISWREGS